MENDPAARNQDATIPALVADGGPGPAFQAPWEAQAFAMTVALHRQGLFAWQEWTKALGREIRIAQEAGDPDLGTNYYGHWLATLERLLADKGTTSCQDLLRYRDAWRRAAERTPHGLPIVLRSEDFSAP